MAHKNKLSLIAQVNERIKASTKEVSQNIKQKTNTVMLTIYTAIRRMINICAYAVNS